MSSSPELFIYSASPIDQNGVVRCFGHGLAAKRCQNFECPGRCKGPKCLRSVYYVCGKRFDDPDRCTFFWWAGQELRPSSPSVPDETAMDERPQAQARAQAQARHRRATRARPQTAKTSPSKRNRSATPPAGDAYAPVTPAAKRLAAIRITDDDTPQAASTSKLPPTSPSKLTPAQRQKRLKAIEEGLAGLSSAAPIPPQDEENKKKKTRQGLLAALQEGLTPAVEKEKDRSLFSPPPKHAPIQGIGQALRNVLPKPSPASFSPPKPIPSHAGAQVNPSIELDTAEADKEEEAFWTSPSRGPTVSTNQGVPTAGPSNAYRSVFNSSEPDSGVSQAYGARTPHPHGTSRGDTEHQHAIPTPSSDDRVQMEMERGWSPSSSAQVSQYLEQEVESEIPELPRTPVRSKVSKGKQREMPPPDVQSQWRDSRIQTPEPGSSLHENSDAFRAEESDGSSLAPESPSHLRMVDTMAEHLSSMQGMLDYIKKLDRKQSAAEKSLQSKSDRIMELEGEVKRLNQKNQQLQATIEGLKVRR